MWWGDRLLHVAHVSPPRDVWVGDDAEGAVDYVLPLRRTCVAHVEAGEVAVSSLVLESDAGVYRSAGGGALRVRVAEVDAAEPPPRGSSQSPPTSVAWACSAAVHLALLAGLAACPSDRLEVDTRELCSAIHDPAALATMTELTERASKRIALLPSASGDDLGAAHAGAHGTLGATTSPPSSAHFTIAGPRETTEVRFARTRALIESGSYASLAALGALSATTTPGPFGGDDSATIGTDRRSVVGNLYGEIAGEAPGSGFGGLGLADGGGSLFSGIGIGEEGVFGAGGFAHGDGRGNAYGFGRLDPRGAALGHKTGAPLRILDTGPDMTGKLPPAVIKRIVHANFPRLQRCYERGLGSDPSLAGTVVVRFIVDATGAMESASLAGGTLDDATVRACILGVFRTLSFPEPESGKVLVSYPIELQRG